VLQNSLTEVTVVLMVVVATNKCCVCTEGGNEGQRRGIVCMPPSLTSACLSAVPAWSQPPNTPLVGLISRRPVIVSVSICFSVFWSLNKR